MAQTLIFNIPAPGPGQDPVYRLNWYESSNGLNWGPRIDTIIISDLVVDSQGKYHWTSQVSDPSKYHQLKTESEYGIESSTGVIIPPEVAVNIDTTPTSLYTEKIDTGNGVYSIGETVELMMEVDDYVAEIIGDNISVFIVDTYGNTIDNVTAHTVGSTLYVAEWKITKNLSKLYNSNNETDLSEYYRLKDKWIMPGNTSAEFEFLVHKKGLEQPVTDNSIISLEISDVESTDSAALFEATEVKFATKLTPFYCLPSDVRRVNKELLSKFNDFEIASEILEHSNHVDHFLKPDKIVRKEAFDFAVSEWVTYSVAASLLSGVLNNANESKEVETFKVSYERNSRGSILENINENVREYEIRILAGGGDTPFRTKTFVKGIFDPNRTKVGRTAIENAGILPYTNKTTSGIIIQSPDGSVVETRGVHTIGYAYGINSRRRYPYEY